MIELGKEKIPQIVTQLESDGIILHKGRNVIYKYVTVEVAKMILESGYIRFSTPAVFNDARDMCADLVDTDMTEQEVDNYISRSIDGHISDESEKSRVREWAKRVNWGKIFQSSVERDRHQSLILCTSKRQDIEKLWTFYAEEGRGVCLGLRMPMNFAEIGLVTAHVKYTQQMQPVKLMLEDENQLFRSIMNWVFTKSVKYSDEEEIRTYIPPQQPRYELEDGKYWYFGLQPFMICEIYYGNQILLAHQFEIEHILKNSKWEIEKRGKMYYPSRSYDLAIKSL